MSEADEGHLLSSATRFPHPDYSQVDTLGVQYKFVNFGAEKDRRAQIDRGCITCTEGNITCPNRRGGYNLSEADEGWMDAMPLSSGSQVCGLLSS